MFKSLIAIGICSVFLGFTFQEGGSGTVQEPGKSETKTDEGMKKEKLAGIKCVVSGKSVVPDKMVKYKSGEVYLCSNECIVEFVANTEKYKTKANHQLVASGQYVQVACPISGKPVSDDVTAKVAAIKIGLCCEDCVKKLGDVETPAVELVFGDEAFKKAFVKKGAQRNKLAGIKCPVNPDKDVKAKYAVRWRGGKVYFCSESCASEFIDEKEELAAAANQQLVQTGQFHQKGCPFTGEPVAKNQSVEFSGMKVGFCCEACKEKVEKAKNDALRTEMVFSDERFEKGFKKK